MVVRARLSLFTRNVKLSRIRFRELGVCKRRTCLCLSTARCYTVDHSNITVETTNSGLERYKDLQKYFKRKLWATYRRFSDIHDNSVMCGHHHVYFLEGDGIYRIDSRQSDPEPEQVLYLGQCSTVTQETDGNKVERDAEDEWTVQRVRLSPRETHLAAMLKNALREEPRCVIVRLGECDKTRVVPHTTLTLDKVFSFEWATDEVLFYTTQEDLRCSRVFRLDLSSTGARAALVYEDPLPDVFVEVTLTRDRRILTISCNSKTSSEVWLINVTTPSVEPLLVQRRLPELLYHVEHWNGWLVILANTGPGQEYQVLKAHVTDPSMSSWLPLHVPGVGMVTRDMEVVGDHCVLTSKVPTGELVLSIFPLAHPTEAYTLQLPSWACAIETRRAVPGQHHGMLELLLSSPVHPPVLYRLSPRDGLLLSGTERDRAPPESQGWGSFITTRLEARSQDDTLVPVTVFHTAPVGSLKTAPLLVHVYGAYGRDLNMEFSPERRLLMEQGWALAYCHIRGGGERGLSWHREACVRGKRKGVEDLLACLRHLFSLGVSSASHTALTACSAGAVPVGALCNIEPHLLRAVTLQAPFLDVLATMEDPSLPLTVEERGEWGDPAANPQHRLAIASYCPFTNITPQQYPSMLLTAYSGDTRVPLAGVLRYAEKLQKAVDTYFTTRPVEAGGHVPDVVVNIQPGASHSGPEDVEMMIEESALQLAFLYSELGLDPRQRSRRRRR